MKRLAAVLALALIMAGAFSLREAAAPGYQVEDPRTGETTWLVDDPDAAYHLRRVELALVSGRVPGSDRYLNHPTGSAIPWPPFSDAMFALVASALADEAAAGKSNSELGGYDEASIEAVLVHLPPLFGALICLAVFAAIWSLCDRSSTRTWCALFGAFLYACTPIAIWYGGVTRIDHHVVIALLLAIHTAMVTWSLRAKKSVDAMTFAIAAGIVAGMSIASWLAAGIFVGVTGIAYFMRALAADEERAQSGARAAILYFTAAAGITVIPAANSAWNAIQPGSLINLTNGVPRGLFAAIIPFVVIVFVRRRTSASSSSRTIAGVVAVVVFGISLALLPGFLSGAQEGLRWASRENLFMDVVAESRPLDSIELLLSKLTPLALLFPLAWLGLFPSAVRSAERAHLVLLAGVLAVMTMGQQRFGNAFAIPFACVCAVALHDVARRFADTVLRKAALVGMAAAALSVLPSARSVFQTTPDEYRDLAEWRGEVVRGLRWMRTNTPSPGPWNAPDHPQDYAVLSSWGLGHMIEYHARRPTITTNFGSFVGERNFVEGAKALIETDPKEFLRRVRELGADYVVVTPRLVSDLNSTMRIAGVNPATLFQRDPTGVKRYSPAATQSALWKLALHDEPVGSKHVRGTELVWVSERREMTSGLRPQPGLPSGPVLSIYRLTDGRDRNTAPSLESGRR